MICCSFTKLSFKLHWREWMLLMVLKTRIKLQANKNTVSFFGKMSLTYFGWNISKINRKKNNIQRIAAFYSKRFNLINLSNDSNTFATRCLIETFVRMRKSKRLNRLNDILCKRFSFDVFAHCFFAWCVYFYYFIGAANRTNIYFTLLLK